MLNSKPEARFTDLSLPLTGSDLQPIEAFNLRAQAFSL